MLVREGRVLLARRAPRLRFAGLWEFPGGKLEDGESPAQALRRELREEMSLTVSVGPELLRTTHDYEFGRVELTAFVCAAPDARALRSTDHDRLEWAAPADLASYPLTPADVPLAARLARGEWARLLAAAR